MYRGDRRGGVMPPITEVEQSEDPLRVRKAVERKLIERDFTEARSLVEGILTESSKTLHKPDISYEELRSLERALDESLGSLARGLLLEFAPDDPGLQDALTASKDIIRQVSERRTEALLESAGPNVKTALSLLTQEHPELASIELHEDEDAASMYHRDADFSNAQRISIKTDDAFYRDAMVKRAISVRVFAELLNIPPEHINTEMLKVFILAHEFGHAHDVLNNYGTDRLKASRAFKSRRKEELSTLLIPGMNPGNLERMIATTPWDALTQTYPQLEGRDPQDVVAEQELAYRHIQPERYADVFATTFAKKHWDQFNFST